MGVPSGGNLGAAQGSITINTTQAQQAVPVMQQVAAGINSAMAGVNTSTNKASASFGGLAGSVRGLAGAFGIGLGVGTISQLARAALAAEEVATAYDRQSVAARGLAGSQGQLNELLEVYERATGGAVDQVAALQNVTKLMSVGFADSSQELEQFATAIRGISIAMGTSQDTVTQNLILELFTQRGARLDQLGLQYDKVRQRADELAAADKGLNDQMAYQQAVLEQANQRFGKLADSAEGAATGMEKAATAWKNFRLEIGQTAQEPLDALGAGIALFIDFQAEKLRLWTNELDFYIKALRALGASMPWLTSFERDMVSSPSVTTDDSQQGLGRRRTGTRVIEGLAEAKLDWAKGVRDINKRLQDDIISQEESYGQQRADTIRNYQKGLGREERDFQRNRLRAELEQLDAIADVWKEATRREARAAEDLARSLAQSRADADESIAEAREDSNKRLAELEEDYQEDREKAARAHTKSLRDAAGRLDAKAIADLQYNYRLEEEEAKEAHDEQRKELAEALQERIDDEEKALEKSNRQAQEAHDRQLEDARVADRLRLEDMKADFAQRKAQEDEDRAIRLSDQAQDHADQLAQMDSAHTDRIAQIKRQAAEELEQHKIDHEAELVRLKAADAAMKERVLAREKILIDSWEKFWKKVQDDLDEANSTTPRTMPGGPVKAFAQGGPVTQTGLALLHAGEFVVPAPMVAASNMGMGGRTVTFNGDVHVSVSGSTNMGESAMYNVARRAFVDALNEVAA